MYRYDGLRKFNYVHTLHGTTDGAAETHLNHFVIPTSEYEKFSLVNREVRYSGKREKVTQKSVDGSKN